MKTRTPILESNNTVEEMEAEAERIIDACTGLNSQSTRQDHNALALFAGRDRLWRNAQDVLALIAELRRMRGEPVKIYP